MRHAVLIVDGTRLCNLRCAYCNDWRVGPDQTMSFAVLARLASSVLGDPLHETVEFNWHGGETTMLPVSFYEKAVLLQARFRRPGQFVHNSIQTNGTRLTPEWARFFKARRFTVGVSLDGPPEIHNRYRRDVAGGPTFHKVREGMQILRDHGVPFAVILVVDQDTLALGPERVFDFFLEEGISDYALNFVLPIAQRDAVTGTQAEHYATPQRVGAFIAGLYDRWRAHGDPQVHVRELEALRKGVARAFPGVCTLTGGCFGSVYRVEPNGDIGHCDYFANDDRYIWGNILTHDFAAIRRSANLRAREEENEQSLNPLSSCPNFGVCNGWCPYERYASVRHYAGHTEGCCGLSDAIDHIRAGESERTRTIAGPERSAGLVTQWGM